MTDQNNIAQEEQQPGKPLSEAQLLAYMEGRLEGDELRAVEQWIATESMESDALEGLQALPFSEAKDITNKLNKNLQQTLSKKKRRKRRGVQEQKWSWIAIVIILLLAAVGFAIVWVMQHK